MVTFISIVITAFIYYKLWKYFDKHPCDKSFLDD
jgi:hypothetical protein